jgi:tetratricopeptide (TPR) repeat protein
MSQEGHVQLLKTLQQLVNGQWPDDATVVGLQSRRLLPSLLIGVGLAALEGKRLTKGEAGDLMPADKGTSGAACIADAESLGYITIQRGAPHARSRQFLVATPKLESLLLSEIGRVLERVRWLDRDSDDASHPDDRHPRDDLKSEADRLRRHNEVKRLLTSVQDALKRNDPERARQYADAALLLHPDNKEALLTRLDVYAHLQRWDKAIADCEKLLTRYRITPPFAVRYARILERLHRTAEAEEKFWRVRSGTVRPMRLPWSRTSSCGLAGRSVANRLRENYSWWTLLIQKGS